MKIEERERKFRIAMSEIKYIFEADLLKIKLRIPSLKQNKT